MSARGHITPPRMVPESGGVTLTAVVVVVAAAAAAVVVVVVVLAMHSSQLEVVGVASPK